MVQAWKEISRFSLMLCLGLIYPQSEAMQYQEPLTIKELDNLFSEDGCIQGTLSATETGSPVIISVSFTGSDSSISHKQNITDSLDAKSPMSLVTELATYNKVKLLYTLTLEEGPSHKKRFGISLDLGDEHYFGEGSSIKKAQHEAAKVAVNSTSYKHPPDKLKKKKIPKYNSTPVQSLNDWARKHNDATVSYSFIQQSSKFGSSHHRHNDYHKNMYLKAENVHKVTVKIGDKQFEGEGHSSDMAKQDAASNALKQLQNTEGFCMFDDDAKTLLTRLFNPNSENSISLVFEFASKSKMKALFELVSEEGPAHIKRFVYKCSVGDRYETFGEGSNKRIAKTEAADNMIQKLKSHLSYNPVNCHGVLKKERKSKNKKSKNLVKSVVKPQQEEEKDLEYSFPDYIDPISKLVQLQQAKYSVQPIFRLIKVKADMKQQFFIEVSVGDMSFVGSGPNKKTAKRNAAEGMLEKLGYSTESGKARFLSAENKKKVFIEEQTTLKKKTLVPGLKLNSEKFVKFDGNTTPMNNMIPKDSKEKLVESKNQNSDMKPKAQLANLAQELGFRFQFSDFPKANNTGFVSLVSLTTDPPKVCYGTGQTREYSQNKAALTALETLYKNKIDLISRMLTEATADAQIKEEYYIIDEKTVKKISFGTEKN